MDCIFIPAWQMATISLLISVLSAGLFFKELGRDPSRVIVTIPTMTVGLISTVSTIVLTCAYIAPYVPCIKVIP